MSDWQILEGDCIDLMASLPAGSVDAVITSPPYAMQRAATYGGVPEAEYPGWTVAWMEQARRLLKPDGSAVINIRPHVRNGTISDYTLRTRLALRDAGWAEIEELIWHKGGAPVGSPYRPRRSWESLHWFALHGRPYSAPKAAGRPMMSTSPGGGRPAGEHFRRGRPMGVLTGIARVPDFVTVLTGQNEADTDLNRHPAVFPPALPEWVGKLVCPPGGTVLDPFSGSGSTGVACIRNGWRYLGIEAVRDYAEMSRDRLSTYTPGLFDSGFGAAEEDEPVTALLPVPFEFEGWEA